MAVTAGGSMVTHAAGDRPLHVTGLPYEHSTRNILALGCDLAKADGF